MHKNIELLKPCIQEISIWAWWKHAYSKPSRVRQCRILARIMFGESSLQCDTSRYNDNGIVCGHCGYGTQTISHILFTCSHVSIEHTRRNEFDKMYKILPAPMFSTFSDMPNQAKTLFILCGMNIDYDREWENYYDCFLNFVYNMYNAHSRLLAQ